MDQNKEKMSQDMKEENKDVEAVPTTLVVGEIDPVVEKRMRWKLDTHIVPLLSALYLLAFLDRSNIGYARPNFTVENMANLDHQQCANRWHGRRPQPQQFTVRMASHHLLYLLHRLRIPRDHVEGRSTASLGSGLRFRLGPRFDRTSCDNFVGRNDGITLYHGSCRDCIRSRGPLSALVLLFEA